VHAIYVRYFARAEEFAGAVIADARGHVPSKFPGTPWRRDCFTGLWRSMFTLLFTAFLPKVGVRFNWVTYHWIAGSVLTYPLFFT
jgi:hypothetical protein